MKRPYRLVLTLVLFSFIGVGFSHGLFLREKIRVEEVEEVEKVVYQVKKKKVISRLPSSGEDVEVVELPSPTSGVSEVRNDSAEGVNHSDNNSYSSEVAAPATNSSAANNTHFVNSSLAYGRPTSSSGTTSSDGLASSVTSVNQQGMTSVNEVSGGYVLSNTDLNSSTSFAESYPHKIKSILLKNGSFQIQGLDLNGVSRVELKSNGVISDLSMSFQSSTEIIASGLSALKLIAGKTYSLIITDAHGASTYPISTELADGSVSLSKLSPFSSSEDG